MIKTQQNPYLKGFMLILLPELKPLNDFKIHKNWFHMLFIPFRSKIRQLAELAYRSHLVILRVALIRVKVIS